MDIFIKKKKKKRRGEIMYKEILTYNCSISVLILKTVTGLAQAKMFKGVSSWCNG